MPKFNCASERVLALHLLGTISQRSYHFELRQASKNWAPRRACALMNHCSALLRIHIDDFVLVELFRATVALIKVTQFELGVSSPSICCFLPPQNPCLSALPPSATTLRLPRHLFELLELELIQTQMTQKPMLREKSKS